MDEFTIQTEKLAGLAPFENGNFSKAEVYEEFIRRYPTAADLISEEMKDRAKDIMGKIFSLGHEDKFTEIFDLTYELLNNVDIKDENWLFATDTEAVLTMGKLMQSERIKMYEIYRLIPKGTFPRSEVIMTLANAYRQLCEGLVTQTYAIIASIGSILNSSGRLLLDTRNWSTFNLAEFIRSIEGGKFSRLTDHYDNVVRNACAHNGISFEMWESDILFKDKTNERIMNGDQFCKLFYDLDLTISNIILAIEFYRSVKTPKDAEEKLKQMPLDTVAALFFEEVRVDLNIKDPNSKIATIKSESIVIEGNKITFTILGPSEQKEQEKWVTSILKKCIDHVVSPIRSIGHQIDHVVVKVNDRVGLVGKCTTEIKNDIVLDINFFPGPRRS